MIDIGYTRFSILPGWIARVDFDAQPPTLRLIKYQAKASIILFSAGDLDAREALNQVYEELFFDCKTKGGHFDDLVEEFEDEMIVESVDSDDFAIEHLFLRYVNNLLVIAKLTDYGPQDEEELREILASLEPGTVENQLPAFERVEIPEDLTGWDRFGSSRVFSLDLQGPR